MLQLETRRETDVTHLEIPVELAVVFSKQQSKLLFRCFYFHLTERRSLVIHVRAYEAASSVCGKKRHAR